MSKDVLFLGLPPIPSGTYSVVNPTTVYYAWSLQDIPKAFDDQDKVWSIHKIETDYGRTNAFLNALQDIPISDTPLIAYLQQDNTAMWQFLPSYIWPAFHRTLDLIEAIDEIIQNHPIQKICYYATSGHMADIWTGVIAAIGRSKNLPTIPLTHSSQTLRTKLRHNSIGRWARKYRHQSEIKRIAKQPEISRTTAKKLLCVTHKRHWVKTPGNVNQFYDEQIYPLLPAFRSNNWTTFVSIDCPYNATITEAHANLQNRKDDTPADLVWRSFHSYAPQAPLAKIRKESQTQFASQLDVLYNSPEFLHHFSYRNTSLFPALSHTFKNAFLDILPTCAENLVIARNMLQTEQPDGIVLTYETGPYQRALIIEAQKLGIPTIGLMHGLIFDYHYDYMHKRITTTPKQSGFSVPDITCVWGPLFKKNLIKSGHYDEKAVAITGNWRHDDLLAISEGLEKKVRTEIYKCKKDQKTVLILSSGQHISDYIRKCLETIQNYPNCVPIIKLHPSDKAAPVRALLEELQYDSQTLFEGQLIEVLSGADIVISQRSTAIAEAALLDKTIVLSDIYGLGHEYGQTGICLCAETPEALKRSIEQAITNPSVEETLAQNRKAFVEEYFYKLDGQSTKRVVDVLETLCASLPQKTVTAELST